MRKTIDLIIEKHGNDHHPLMAAIKIKTESLIKTHQEILSKCLQAITEMFIYKKKMPQLKLLLLVIQ